MQKAIINVKIFDYETYIENGFCIFDEKIVKIGEMKDYTTFEGAIIDGKGKILLPGLINFHTHIYSTLVRGASLGPYDPQSFKDILEQLWWKFDRELTNESIYHSAIIYGLESLRNGVTSLIDHHASGKDILGSLENLKQALVDVLGMRGIFCFETSDRFDIDACIKENLTGLKFDSADAKGMFGLHASMSLSDETLRKVKTVIGKAPMHTHAAESKEDEEDSLEKYGVRVVERFAIHGLLNPDSILAHCVHIDDHEAKTVKENKAVIALNPTSNMNNAVGGFNIELFRKYTIPILVGTDGLGSNIAKEWSYLLYAGKQYIDDANGITLDEIRAHIIRSYDYFGRQMGIKIGKIKKGYVADLLLVDYTNPTPMNKSNAFGHVFYGLFDSFKPSHVFVKGKELVSEYKSKFDEKELYKKAKEASQSLWKRISEE